MDPPKHWQVQGDACYLRGDLVGAVRHYQRLLQEEPRNAQVHYNLGTLFSRQRQYVSACEHYRQAVALLPRDPDVHHNLALALLHLGEREQAAQHFKLTLQLQPENTGVAYYLAMLTQQGMMNRAPEDYVTSLFDEYADHYDAHMCGDEGDSGLGYSVPAQLRQWVESHCTVPLARFLDLGCGTGLVGQALREVTQYRVGLDVSSQMLAKAQAKGVYQQLVHGDMGQLLQAGGGDWSLIVAADVFPYWGDLAPLFQAIHRQLIPGGWFAFSCELGTQADYALQPTGRFAHNPNYIGAQVGAGHWEVRAQQSMELRHQDGVAVHGQLWLLQRPFAKMAANHGQV